MSHARAYESRRNNMIEILKHFALNKEVPQFGLEKIIGCSYRTIIRELRALHSDGFIKLLRSQAFGEKGKARNIWSPRFRALLYAWYLFENQPDKQDLIADIHKDAWSIFQEWDYLSRNPEIRECVRRSINMSKSDDGYSTFNRMFDYIGKYSGTMILSEERAEEVNDYVKRRMEITALALESMFSDSNWEYWKGEWVTQVDILTDRAFDRLDYFLKNPRLRIIIERHIKLVEKQFERAKLIREKYDI